MFKNPQVSRNSEKNRKIELYKQLFFCSYRQATGEAMAKSELLFKIFQL